MGLLAHTNTEVGWIFVLLNGFIHTVMYSYYGAALAGVRLGFLRPIITSGQIIQFLTGFTIIWSYKNVPCFGGDPAQMVSWWYNYIYVGAVFFLLAWFFAVNYLKKKSRSRSKAQKELQQQPVAKKVQ